MGLEKIFKGISNPNKHDTGLCLRTSDETHANSSCILTTSMLENTISTQLLPFQDSHDWFENMMAYLLMQLRLI
ncbi:hypothetical protein GJ496_003769 [Pomphorhynchus laevis]|nr:hypothetical protein GJ496_003769 [Pomphorhynchus laevis]